MGYPKSLFFLLFFRFPNGQKEISPRESWAIALIPLSSKPAVICIFLSLFSIIAEQAIATSKPQVPSASPYVDGETVVDIKTILSAYEFKVLAIKAKNAFLHTVEKGSYIPDPYITSPDLARSVRSQSYFCFDRLPH